MSLIDEALKRARQEAARQEATEREARYARVPVYVPPPRRARPWLLPVVVGACLVVGVTAGVVISRRTPAERTPAAMAGLHSQVSASPSPEPAALRPLPLSPTPARPPAPTPSGRGGTPVEVVEPPAESPSPPVVAPPPQAPAVDTGPVVALPQIPPAEPRSYVREMPLPGGGTLRLNGIAFSAHPVALFGDKVVAPGETVSGFTVVEIEAQRVKLQGPGGIVYVSLK